VGVTETGLKVLLATGHEVLDRELTACGCFQVLGQVLYREAVVTKAAKSGVDAVVLAVFLPGRKDLRQVIYDLRRLDIRVILLAGDRENADGPLLARAVGLGVYDLLFDPVWPEDVARAALHPAGFAGAALWLEEVGGQAEAQGTVDSVSGHNPGGANFRSSGPRRSYRGTCGGDPLVPGKTSPGGDCPNHLITAGYPDQIQGTRREKVAGTLAEAPAVYEVNAPPARLVVFASPRAGVGRSFLGAAFGIWLAGREAVVLADLDEGRGGFRWWFGLGRPKKAGTLITHPSGLGVIREDTTGGIQLINELTAVFRTVIITLPDVGREGALELLKAANHVFLVATPERGVLDDCRRELYAFRHLGLDPSHVHLVLNRLDRNAGIRLGEVGSLLSPTPCTVVPASGATPEEALRGFRFRRSMEDLERAVAGGQPRLKAKACFVGP